jgi:hypothetical protein
MSKRASRFEVVVGNIGCIPQPSLPKAEEVYREYVEQSKSGVGRAGGEFVTLLVDGEPLLEHFGDMDEEDQDE